MSLRNGAAALRGLGLRLSQDRHASPANRAAPISAVASDSAAGGTQGSRALAVGYRRSCRRPALQQRHSVSKISYRTGERYRSA